MRTHTLTVGRRLFDGIARDARVAALAALDVPGHDPDIAGKAPPEAGDRLILAPECGPLEPAPEPSKWWIDRATTDDAGTITLAIRPATWETWNLQDSVAHNAEVIQDLLRRTEALERRIAVMRAIRAARGELAPGSPPPSDPPGTGSGET